MASTNDQLVLIQCVDLETGMYVAELDRTWDASPFTSHGFLITHRTQIEALQRSCDYVYVDPNRSDPTSQLHITRQLPSQQTLAHRRQNDALLALDEARIALEAATALVNNAIHHARRNGQIDLDSIYAGLVEFVDSTLKNADGMQWLVTTEPARGFLNRRALGTAMMCVLFGRHLGFDRHELNHLALGGLLLDIGKVTVPITILAKPGPLSPEEKWFTTRHVQQSLAMIPFNGENLDRVFSMISAHHERLDGSGYPNQVGGTDIPLFARIAGIVDTFDALTLHRRYAPARSGYSALRFISAMRRNKFDAALADEFIDSLGVYPIGTPVQLDDGSTGFVLSQNQGQPRQPNVLLTNDAAGRPVKSIRIVTAGSKQPITQAFPVACPR